LSNKLQNSLKMNK